MTDKNIIYEPATTTHWKNLHPKKCMLLGTQNLNPNEELVLVIKDIKANQKVKGGNGREDTVTFIEFDNAVPMCLNISNSRVLASLYGDRYDQWIGKPIQIYAAEVKAVGGGKTMGLCIRSFIPDLGGDVSEYLEAIERATTLEELQTAYMAAPKNIQPKLNKLTNQRKKELS